MPTLGSMTPSKLVITLKNKTKYTLMDRDYFYINSEIRVFKNNTLEITHVFNIENVAKIQVDLN